MRAAVILVHVTQIEVVEPRTVPLGTGDAMQVERAIPQRALSLVGAWCFLDHFGQDVGDGQANASMRVAPHPHTGLQTVTWLFSGEIEHRDGLGTQAVVLPGEVNLMTAGWGITHTEYSVGPEPLHGVQLWIALPDSHRFVDPRFEHFAPEPVRMDDHEVAVFVGRFGDAESPVEVHSPLVGAEIRFTNETPLVVDVDESWEFGLLADSGAARIEGVEVPRGRLGYAPPGRSTLTLSADAEPGRVVTAILIGGKPLDADIVMWWNFVGRSHDEIVRWRANWQLAIGAETGGDNAGNFPLTPRTDDEPAYPAPPMPAVRLRPRHRRN
ncbi:pirin family protein [Brooklawnia cerclae]